MDSLGAYVASPTSGGLYLFETLAFLMYSEFGVRHLCGITGRSIALVCFDLGDLHLGGSTEHLGTYAYLIFLHVSLEKSNILVYIIYYDINFGTPPQRDSFGRIHLRTFLRVLGVVYVFPLDGSFRHDVWGARHNTTGNSGGHWQQRWPAKGSLQNTI